MAIEQCEVCKQKFESSDSLSFWHCQECWEKLCDDSWWDMIASITEEMERQGLAEVAE